MKSPLYAWTWVAIAVVVAALFVVVDPAQPLRPSALYRTAGALGAVVVALVAAVGFGGACLEIMGERERFDGPVPLAWLPAATVGMLAWGLGGLVLALAGLLSPAPLWVLTAALGLGWLRRPAVSLPRPTAGVALIAAGVALVGLVDASAPPIDTDELYQHLALPTRMLQEGALVGGLLHPDGSRPLLLHLPFTALQSLAGDTAPRLLVTASAVGLLLATDALARRVLPDHTGDTAAVVGALALAGSYTVLHDAGLAANNLPTALAVLATFAAARAPAPRTLALTAATALSFKYTAAGAMVGIWLVARLPWSRRLLPGVVALALVSPWWIRNALEGLHPLFPYAGWDALPPTVEGELQFQYLDKYGAGRSVEAMLMLPWNAVMTAEIGSFRFLGRLSPLFAFLPVPAVVGLWRRPGTRPVAAAALVAALAWAAGPHWLRHLLPALPLVALALGTTAATAVPRMPLLTASLIVWTAGAPANLAPIATHLADRLPVALGTESRADYLSRSVRSADAVAWANEHLPEDARVALLFDWSTHLLKRPSVLGSVEDHVPTRFWVLSRGDTALTDLRDLGVTHLMVGRFRFLRKWYPFIEDDEYEAMFDAPVQALEHRLLQDATLVYEAGHTRVYRLEGPSRPKVESPP